MNMNAIIAQLKKQPANDGNLVVCVPSTIAGYHKFRVRPLPGLRFPLLLNRESTNPLHSNALLVKSYPEGNYVESVRTFASENHLDLFEREIGRCPRKLADIVAALFDNNHILQGRSVCSGKRMFLGHQAGGGQHLECLYLFKTKDIDSAKQLKMSLKDNGLDAFLLTA